MSELYIFWFDGEKYNFSNLFCSKLLKGNTIQGFKISSAIFAGYPQELVISQNFSGHIVTHTDWPSVLRNKGVFFVKREPEPLPKENFLNFMTCGDIHPNALDHFCAWVEEVIAPILKLEANLHKFPQCIADDIKRQVHELSTSVYQIRGYIKGRTLLPFPQVFSFG